MYIRSKVWVDVATCLGGCSHMPACSTIISFKAGLDVIRRYLANIQAESYPMLTSSKSPGENNTLLSILLPA